MHKYAIPGAIVLAGLLIAGAVILSNGSDTTGNGSGVTADDLDHDPKKFTALMEEVGVNGKTLGSPDAPITLVEYSDTECPFCNRFHGTMKQVMETYGRDDQVAWTYRHFPIKQLHSKAPKEARALECVFSLEGDKAFWTAVDTLYSITPGNNKLDHDKLPAIAELAGADRDAFSECLKSGKHKDVVQSDIENARAAGGSGTPFSVIKLSEPLDRSARQAIQQLDDQVSSQRELFQIKQDNKRIAMSGAMPYQILDQLFARILDSEPKGQSQQ